MSRLVNRFQYITLTNVDVFAYRINRRRHRYGSGDVGYPKAYRITTTIKYKATGNNILILAEENKTCSAAYRFRLARQEHLLISCATRR